MSLEEKLKEIPPSPGVYLHKDTAGKVIYVGKAKNLRSRVRSYFRARPFDRKTDALVGQITDFEFILTDNEVEALILEASLVKQYRALLATEGIDLEFRPEAIEEIAALAEQINATVENIGARRLHTILERLLEEISFTASDRPSGTMIAIDSAYVRERVGALAQNDDLSRFIL